MLKMLAQKSPDSYFVMYHPVLQIQQASVELSMIIISPLEIFCAAFMEAEEDTVYIGSKHRFWEERGSGKDAPSIESVSQPAPDGLGRFANRKRKAGRHSRAEAFAQQNVLY